MISTNDFLLGALLPAVVAAVAMAAAWQLTRCATVAWLAGFVLGYLSGHWGLDARGTGLESLGAAIVEAVAKSFRPHEARDWMPCILVLMAMPEEIMLFGKRSQLAAWPMRAAASGFLGWRLLSLHKNYPTSELVQAGLNDSAWSWAQVTAAIAGIAATVLLLWRLSLAAKDQPAPVCRTLLTILVATGGAAMLALSGSLTIGQLMGVAAAALGGCGAAALLLRVGQGPEAAPAPLIAVMGGLWLLAYLFIEGGVTLTQVALLVASLAAALSALPLTKVWQIGFRSAACLVPLAIAVAMAASDFAATQSIPETKPAASPYQNWQP